MENEIKKPLSVARAEFINALSNLINNAALPPFAIESILKDMYNDVRIISHKQLEADTKKYQEQLAQKDSQTRK